MNGQVYDDMVRRGVTPSLLSFRTLMNGAGASGDLDVAVEVSALASKCRGLAGKTISPAAAGVA